MSLYFEAGAYVFQLVDGKRDFLDVEVLIRAQTGGKVCVAYGLELPGDFVELAGMQRGEAAKLL